MTASPDITPGNATTGQDVRDEVFVDPGTAKHDFAFDSRTAAVFDDMVSRSVPFYGEMQRMTAELVADYAQPDSRLYDIGCATGTTFEQLDPLLDPSVSFVGIDTSGNMIEKAAEKLAAVRDRRNLELVVGDATRDVEYENASATLLVLTLQFVRPPEREPFIAKIARGTRPGGCLVLIEKLLFEDGRINRQFIEHYYELKRRQGYTEMEIAGKREALENVLIPYRYDENVAMLRRAGFSVVEEFFRWYNFAGLLAIR